MRVELKRSKLTDRFVKSATTDGRKSPIFMDDEVIGFGDHSFDVVVLGAGGAGLRATLGMVAAGLERDEAGLNRLGIPESPGF
jgi:hypothetical protein